MVVAVIDKSFGVKLKWRRPTQQRVTNVSCVSTLAHPDASFQAGIAQGINPGGDRSIESKAFDVLKSLRSYRAAGPLVRSEFVGFAAAVDNFVECGNKLRAPDGRMKRSQKNSVIAARGATCDGSGSIATDSVCDEPFAGGRSGKIVAEGTIESDHVFCDSCHGARCLLVRLGITHRSALGVLRRDRSSRSDGSRRVRRRCHHGSIRGTEPGHASTGRSGIARCHRRRGAGHPCLAGKCGRAVLKFLKRPAKDQCPYPCGRGMEL